MVKVEKKNTWKITGRCSSSAHLGFQNGRHFQRFLAYIYFSAFKANQKGSTKSGRRRGRICKMMHHQEGNPIQRDAWNIHNNDRSSQRLVSCVSCIHISSHLLNFILWQFFSPLLIVLDNHIVWGPSTNHHSQVFFPVCRSYQGVEKWCCMPY